MPTGYERDRQETETEDTLRRIRKLHENPVLKQLHEMHVNCHRQVKENENLEHLPMIFVRYQEGEDETTRELFYICRRCLSDWMVNADEETLKRIFILRGRLTQEAERTIQEKLRKRM